MTEDRSANGYDWIMTKNQEKSEKLLLELTAIPTAAGHEGRVQAFLDGWLARRSKSLTWKRDRAGNLLIRRRNPSRRAPLLITAHLDHPAFVVRSIDDREVTLEFRGGVHDPYFVFQHFLSFLIFSFLSFLKFFLINQCFDHIKPHFDSTDR